MNVAQVMTKNPEYLAADASIREAAARMRETGRGFTPIAHKDKLVGIVTDRDIAIRGTADGKSADDRVGDIATGKVLYCYEDDDVRKVLQNMQDQGVQRLIVLNNERNKDMVGVVTLSDIAAHCEDDELAKRVVNACRHYH